MSLSTSGSSHKGRPTDLLGWSNPSDEGSVSRATAKLPSQDPPSLPAALKVIEGRREGEPVESFWSSAREGLPPLTLVKPVKRLEEGESHSLGCSKEKATGSVESTRKNSSRQEDWALIAKVEALGDIGHLPLKEQDCWNGRKIQACYRVGLFQMIVDTVDRYPHHASDQVAASFLHRKAMAQYQLGDYEGVVKTVESVTSRFLEIKEDTYVQLLLSKAKAILALGKAPEKVIAMLEQVSCGHLSKENRARLDYVKAEALYLVGKERYDDVLKIVEQSFALQPDKETAVNLACLAAEIRFQRKERILALELIIKCAYDQLSLMTQARLLITQTKIYLSLGGLRHAKELLKHFIATHQSRLFSHCYPQYLELWAALVEAELHDLNYEVAFQLADRCLKSNRICAEKKLYFGHIQACCKERLGEAAEAIKIADFWLEMASSMPSSERATLARLKHIKAQALMAQNRNEEVIDLIGSIDRSGLSHSLQVYLVWTEVAAYNRLKRSQEAIGALRECIKCSEVDHPLKYLMEELLQRLEKGSAS